MKTDDKWPKVMTSDHFPAYCCVCHKPIVAGEQYYFVRRKGTRYLHADCYREELRK